MDGAYVWVLESNHHARAFYEHLGGQVVGRKRSEMAGIATPQVAYGWPELALSR
jgi:hypothetical protein